MAKPSPGISRREFAKLEKCSEGLVRRKIKDGSLPTLSDGTLDPALVGTAWCETNRKQGDDPVEVIADKIISHPSFEMLSEHQAKTKKENFLAKLRELEYDEKSGEVVLVSEVNDVVIAAFARVRNKLLSIPTKLAHRIIVVKSAEEAKALMDDEIALALQELVYDSINKPL